MAADDALGYQFPRRKRGYGVLPGQITTIWNEQYNDDEQSDSDADAGDAGAGDGGDGGE
jgi:hypothetical protein